MKDYAPGDVVLLAFPFADGVAVKRRPALVLHDAGDEDLLLARITSQTPRAGYDIALTQWQDAGLLLPSTVRVHKVATLEKKLVEQKLGRLADEDWRAVQTVARRLCATH